MNPDSIAGLYDELRLPEGLEGRPYTAINMVMTADGAVAGPGPGYWPLGGEADQRAYRRLRIHFDAIIRGARTLDMDLDKNLIDPDFLAARGARGRPEPPLIATVTNSGSLDSSSRVFRARRYPYRPLVFTCMRAAVTKSLEEAAEVVRLGESSVDLPAVFGYLADQRGVSRLLCEGGPTLNYAVVAAGLADDFFLTIAPKLIGESRPRTAVEGRPPFPADALPMLRLLSHQAVGSETFLRYRFRSSPFEG